MRDYHIAWWNLENLFDEEDAVALGRRTDKVFRAIQDDIAGWTPQLRDRKIHQLASVIAGMNMRQGPDLLGVCEVENRFVLDRLVDAVNAALPAPRSYTVVHADTDDARGIDVAFIYDDTLFQLPAPPEESVFFHVVMRRNATREIVQVNFQHHRGRPDLGGVRQPLAQPQRRPARVGRLPRHRRRDPRLLPRAGARGARPGDPDARHGRLQRRTVRRLAGSARAEHPATSKGHVRAGEPPAVEPDVARRGGPRRELLLRQPAQRARPVPRQQVHVHRRCRHPGRAHHGQDPQATGHGQHRRLQEAHPVRGHGRPRQPGRVLRPLPHHGDRHRDRLPTQGPVAARRT